MARPAQYSLASFLTPAMAIIADQGLNALSFRSLAQMMGISVSSITNLAGSKAQLVTALINEAHRRNAAIIAPLLELAAQSAPLSPDGLAELADLALESAGLAEPNLPVFLCELVQASATDADVASALEPWFAKQRDFWRQLSAASPSANSQLIGEALFAFAIDERAHGTALQSVAAYRRLRRLCLGRICRLDFGGRGQNGDSALFAYLFQQLGEIDDSLGIDRDGAPPTDARQHKLAMVAARVLVYEGASELTHRAVAARAGVPSSTLAYHFRRREDLIKGAMQVIILRLKHAMFASDTEPDTDAGDNPGFNIARSTFALALEASRSPQYLGSAADMRRKRGINLIRVLNAERTPDRHVDALGAQALAIVTIGATMATAYRGMEPALQGSNTLMSRLLDSAERHVDTAAADNIVTIPR